MSITSGAGGARITIGDVAARAGVSIATVSRVVNERYGVAPETGVRVREVIEELGYESSLIARSLRSQRTNVIGILVAGHRAVQRRAAQGRRAGAARVGVRARRLLRRHARAPGVGAPLPVTPRRHARRRHHPRHPERRRGARDPSRGGGRPPRRWLDAADGRRAELRGRPRRDRPPDRARPPPHRLPRRALRPRIGPPPRGGLPRRDRGRRHRLRPRADPSRRVHRGDRRRAGACAALARRPADRHLRGQRPVGDPGDAEPPPSSGSTCPTTSRWSASTTSPSRRSPIRR